MHRAYRLRVIWQDYGEKLGYDLTIAVELVLLNCGGDSWGSLGLRIKPVCLRDQS